jgi:hypothetical protein
LRGSAKRRFNLSMAWALMSASLGPGRTGICVADTVAGTDHLSIDAPLIDGWRSMKSF